LALGVVGLVVAKMTLSSGDRSLQREIAGDPHA